MNKPAAPPETKRRRPVRKRLPQALIEYEARQDDGLTDECLTDDEMAVVARRSRVLWPA